MNAQILLINPAGKRIGFEPWLGNEIDEIVEGSYNVAATGSLDTSSDITSRELDLGTVDSISDGDYKICVWCNGQQSFWLDIHARRNHGVVPFSIHATSRSGRPSVFALHFSNNPNIQIGLDSVVANETIAAGVFLSGSTLSVRAKPSLAFSRLDTMRASYVTLRWRSSWSIQLGAVVSNFGFDTLGGVTTQGGFCHQTYRTTRPSALNWQGGQEYELFTVPVSGLCGAEQFELTNALSGGEWFVDIDYTDRTDSSFYQPVAQVHPSGGGQ